MDIKQESKIGVICGGISSEREISLRSGKNCFDALLRKGYLNSQLIDIKSVEDIFNLNKKIDVAFLITHGKYGEDGCIQGIFEWLQIPYTGSSPLASALSMDKWVTKQLAKNLNILIPSAYKIDKNNLSKSWGILSKKNGAIFLKPINDGSSVNTFKIKSLKDLKEKINILDLNNCNYIIEEFIKGREITTSIVETKDSLLFLPILELKPKNEFYDYEAKYTHGLTEFILPAKINSDIEKAIKDNSIKIFQEIGCSGFARVDYILEESGKAYLLEVNSLPGMTDISDLPAQAKCAGIEYDNLVEMILKTAKLHNVPSRISKLCNIRLKK